MKADRGIRSIALLIL